MHHTDSFPQELGMDRRHLLQVAATLTGVGAAAVLLESCDSSADQAPNPSDHHASPHSRHESFTPAHTRWEQDFKDMPDGALSHRYWNIDTGNTIPGYNQEAETLTRHKRNVRVENGLLILEAHKEHVDGRDYSSAHINTRGKFDFVYGTLEATMRVPHGAGTWPAFWLLADGEKYSARRYGVPASKAEWPLQGEVDIMEAVGKQPGDVYANIHTYHTETSRQDEQGILQVPRMSEDFHTYGVHVSKRAISFSCDGKTYHIIHKHSDDPRVWPFDQPKYVILNLAMGGTWGGPIAGDGPWEMAVRSLRYLPLKH